MWRAILYRPQIAMGQRHANQGGGAQPAQAAISNTVHRTRPNGTCPRSGKDPNLLVVALTAAFTCSQRRDYSSSTWISQSTGECPIGEATLLRKAACYERAPIGHRERINKMFGFGVDGSIYPYTLRQGPDGWLRRNGARHTYSLSRQMKGAMDTFLFKCVTHYRPQRARRPEWSSFFVSSPGAGQLLPPEAC